jgi:ABC-type antimicrobial peptide transport system permease subunit
MAVHKRGADATDRTEQARQFWAGRHASPLSAGLLAIRRLNTAWRLLLPAWIGILLAVVLVGTVPLYTRLVTNIQLAATVNRQGPVGRNIEVTTINGQLPAPGPYTLLDGISAEELQQEDAIVYGVGARTIAWFTQSRPTQYLTINPTTLTALGTRSFDVHAVTTPEITLQGWDFSQVGPHMRVLAGSLPRAGVNGPPGVMITAQMAQNEHVHVGDLISAVQYYPYQLEYNTSFTLRVSGIWQPLHPDEGFWNGQTFISVPTCDFCPFIYPALLDRTAFDTLLDGAPGFYITQVTIFYGVPRAITTDNYTRVIASMAQFRSQVPRALLADTTNVQVLSDLDHALQDLQRQMGLLGLPLDVVTAQLVGLPLLFVMLMGMLVIEAQAPELATLASRGASRAQLVGSYAGQIVPLAVVAVVLGIWLARLLALGLATWAMPPATLAAAQISGADLARLSTIQPIVVPAIAGALLGVAAVVVAMLAAARLDTLSLRREQAGSVRPSLWRRLYLDIALAVISLLAYFDLLQFGGLAVRQQAHQAAPSPLLPAAPSLLVLAGALLLLRVAPLAARLGHTLAARAGGATGLLAFAQLERRASTVSRGVLLLALAFGVGLFALTFDASLGQNAAARAAYAAGADVRLVQAPAPLPWTDQTRAQVAALPGVAGVTPALRQQTDLLQSDGQVARGAAELLAVDPASWQQAAGVTSWRSDYAGQSLDALLAAMRRHQGAPDVAIGTAQHPIWALISDRFAAVEHLAVGDHISVLLPFSLGSPVVMQVGALVHDFPTLYPAATPAGYFVISLNDYTHASAQYRQAAGANELWLKVAPGASQRAALLDRLDGLKAKLELDQVIDRQRLLDVISGNPVQVGIRGLLLLGAAIAALVAVIGLLTQAVLALRLRTLQFAILRTLGMGAGGLRQLMFGEQMVVYLFGLLGGTALGALLATSTAPFLQFSDTPIGVSSLATLDVPPYALAVNPVSLGLFYAVLLVTFAAVPLIAVRYATRLGLGKTLRLGED